MRTAAILLVLLLAGCRSTKPSERWGTYTGPEELRWTARAEYERLLQGCHFPKAEAKKWSIKVELCQPTGRDKYGLWYSCDQRCHRHPTVKCLCGWGTADRYSRSGHSMLVYPEGQQPAPVLLAEEFLHPILVHYLGEYGHPPFVTINGKVVDCKKLVGANWMWSQAIKGAPEAGWGELHDGATPKWEEVQ
jgi:hypothetical protein